MNLISCEKLEKSMVELQFSIDAETFKAAVNNAFKREGKKYAIPGFRKGKAPRHMIEKMYGSDIFHYDAVNDLFPEAYEAAVKEAKIDVVGRPDPEVVSMSEADGVVLKVKVAVKPEVELGEYAGLTVTKEAKNVNEADVDAEVKRMQDRNGRLLTREGAAENGDTVDIDFEGFVDGKAFEGGKAEHYSLVLGSGSFIPGFEDQVVGHSAGEEFDVNVKFPEEYGAAELAGKDATFKIKLHEVKYKELPALDDDFAKDVSEYDTLDELKDSIRNNIKTNLDKQAEQKVENDLMDQVIANMKADIPDAEVKRMQDRNGRLLTREGAAENGDTVDIDFEGFVDGKAFEGGKAEHYSLVLGSGSFIPGFEDQVVGHSAGEEFDVNVKFPEEYGAAELAGKDATFKIKLHEVKYKELPALDDDFAKDVSEYDTLDELKDSIRNNIKTNLDKQAEQKVENDLMDQVIANMKADIPDAMVDSRIDELVQDFEYRISQQGLKLADYLKYMGMNIEQFRAQFKEQADKQVKMRLAMEAIVAKEGITASDEEFEEEVKRIADAYKMEADKVKSIVDAAAVKADLAINKAIDFVKEKANVVTAEPKEEEKQD